MIIIDKKEYKMTQRGTQRNGTAKCGESKSLLEKAGVTKKGKRKRIQRTAGVLGKMTGRRV